MKKLSALVLALILAVSLIACDKGTEADSAVSSTVPSVQTEADIDNKTEKPNKNPVVQKQPREEYVETYFVYAEEGAVVTWFDSKTGEFEYKWKCETCGETQNGSTSGHRAGKGSKLNAGFTCNNSKCAMWGKPQRSIIGCEVSGEWVEVYD